MTELDSSDFVSMDVFPLGWRFSSDRVGDLSSELQARIHPLSAELAAHLGKIAKGLCREGATFGVTFRSDDPPHAVRAQLLALPPDPMTDIVVSWDAKTALVTDWQSFVDHWDDFCYPSSDDITIWPLDRSWTLCYRHFEIFQFDAHLRAV
jgi:hypothetical protein